jgi:DNA ligase (NAD+)
MADDAPISERLRRLGPQEVEASLRELSAADLAALIRQANQDYWEHDAPRLPDPLYDRLVERLRSLDPEAAVLSELGQPVPTGTPLKPSDAARLTPGERFGQAVVHDRPMLSLDKVYGPEELESWAAKIEGGFLVMPKLDGVACSIRFQSGRLVLAATRGSGTEGEDVTMNVLQIPGLPAEAGDQDFEVRGEVFMTLAAFTEFSEEYANPRNLTAGSLKNKDPANSRTRALSFGAYDLLGLELATETEKLARLKLLGIPTVDHEFVDRDSLRPAFMRLSERRAELGYEIDGVVYRADRVTEQLRLGATGHHPRYAMAYKFQGDTGETVVEDIMWSVSRSGTITPVARVVPIELSGAMIARISLHNLSRFQALDIRRGSVVEVTRRGGVIPHVERTVTRGKGASFSLPTQCPACGAGVEVRKKRDGQFLQCVDPDNCTVARLRELEHFAKVVDVQGFGPKAIAQLAEAGLLSSPVDFYRLRAEDISGLERLGDKSAQNLVDQVNDHRELPLPTFLQALGVDHLGQQNSLLLAGVFGTLDRVRAATREDLMEIKGIKEAIADALVTGLAGHRELIDGLLDEVTLPEYVAPPRPDVGDAMAPLVGMSFVFTGTLESLDRKKAQTRVRSLGGDTPTGVSKTLTYLVIGGGGGPKSSKQKKAEKLVDAGEPLKIISEQEFIALLDGPQ